MRFDSFGRTLAFGAVAAVVSPAVWLLAGPLVGVGTALGLYWIACAALYLVGIAPSRARGLALALPMAVLACAAWAAAPLWMGGLGGHGAVAAALVAALALSLGRACLFAARPARAALLEAVLLGGGLSLAGWLATPGPLGAAAALWGFFLVQSAFFLVGPPRPRPEAGEPDPFERARSRMLALLDEERV